MMSRRNAIFGFHRKDRQALGDGEMSEQEYTVTIDGPGLRFSQAIDGNTAVEIMARAMNGGDVGPVGSLRPVDYLDTEHEVPVSDGPVAISEFLAELDTPGYAEKIAGIILFGREHLDRKRMAIADLPHWFQQAGQSPPTNLPRDVRTAVRKKLISEDTTHAGEYFVTQTGVVALRQTDSSDTGASSRSSGRPSRTSSKSKVSRAACDTDTIDSSKSRSKPKRRQRSASASGPGPMDRVRELVASGWFDEPRTVKHLVDELARRGAQYKGTDFTYAMQTLVRSGDLVREKQTDGSGREVWHYTTPNAAPPL